MKKLLPIIMLLAAGSAANAGGLTHKLSSSVQLTVDAAATNVQRVGNSYTVAGNNVTTSYTGTGTGASAVTNGIGQLDISSGVSSLGTVQATQATPGESFSFSQVYTQGDAIVTSAPSVGAVDAYSNQTSTAAGSAGDLAGTIDSSGTLAITAGGAGTSAVGQFVSEISILN